MESMTMIESIRELTTIKRANEIRSEQVLSWSKRVEVQKVQKAKLDTTKESTGFNIVRKAS